MSDKSLFDAIASRDLAKVSEMIHREVQYTNCYICDVEPGHREMEWGGVICEACDDSISTPSVRAAIAKKQSETDLRARLSLEQSDSQERVGANTWQDRDADEYGVNRTGPID